MRDELGITESLVVATVSKELSCVFEEEPEIFLANLGLLSQTAPIAIAGSVESEDKVIDRLGFGGDLAERDTSALKCRPIQQGS